MINYTLLAEGSTNRGKKVLEKVIRNKTENLLTLGLWLLLLRVQTFPFKILFQYNQGKTYFFNNHMLQRGLLWSKGNVSVGILS